MPWENMPNERGIQLSKDPFAEKIQLFKSPDDILRLLQERERAFKEYRDRNRTLISCLTPAVNVIHAFSATLGEVVSLVSRTHGFFTTSILLFQPNLGRSLSLQQKPFLLALMFSSLYVHQIHSLNRDPYEAYGYKAASGVSSSYDTLLDLFESLGNFLSRLEVYSQVPPTPMMTDIIIKVIVELLRVLGLATKRDPAGANQ